MTLAEVDLFGVYVAPITVMMVVAWLILIPLRWAAGRVHALRFAWHPALLGFAVYVIILSSIVLFAVN